MLEKITREILDGYNGNLTWLPSRVVYLTVHGSHAYGLANETSDVDFSGVCVPPREYFTGFLHRFEQAEFRDKLKPEGVIFSVVKFIQLAADCNPNVIETLWTRDEDHVVNGLGERLLDNRDYFLSQRARYSFSGYAVAQLKRIKTHRKWLLSPPREEPKRSYYGLPERTLIPDDQRGAAAVVLENARAAGDPVDLSPNFLEILQKENAYKQARREWEQYQNWLKTRNPARAELEAKFGYDTKHAMHLVRLMRMAKEILILGKVITHRPDREELLRIRAGTWEYDQLVEYAERSDQELEALAETSSLPKKPNLKYLDALCREIVDDYIACIVVL